MCGIAGILSFKNQIDPRKLRQMSCLLEHRGPDSHGEFMEEHIGLSHTRLSILDLSERGNQPMHSHNNRYVMVYNGEVYNYKEIASELILKNKRVQNISFSSSSDSEIILEAFSAWGPSFVDKLNGMFAIAIFDKELNELHLFRDRIGIKPIYYAYLNDNFIFSSELKSLMACGLIKNEINSDAISDFLNLGFIPAPQTIYKEAQKLEAATYIKIDRTGIQSQKFWSVRSAITDNIVKSEKEALVKLSDLLMSSIQYQLKSDVPFGVFLSGGIDSSLVTAQAVNLSNVKINTFSIGFEENKYDESAHARLIANYLGTNHHEFIVSYKDAMSMIDDVFETYGEPFGDSSAIPTMLVSKMAKQHVTVTLSGEGGDELFLGYGSYRWAKRLDNPLVKSLRKTIYSILSSSSNNRYKRAAQVFNYESEQDKVRHIFSQEQYLFSKYEIEKLTGRSSFNEFKFQSDLKRKLSPMEYQSFFDLLFYLPDDLLTKVDRASMKYSLETRVPYLDHRVVEFALNLSPELKFKNGISKYILKEILYQYIPAKYFDRPKQGFAIPLNKWLKGELSFLIQEYLNPSIIRKYNFIKEEEVGKLLKRYNKGEDYLYNRVWHLIVLHKWACRYCP